MGKNKDKLVLDVNFFDYMDMEIPFWELKDPKTEYEKKMFIKRYLKEYGEDFMLSPWVDPLFDIDEGGNDIEYTQEELYLERAKILKAMNSVPDDDKERKEAIDYVSEQHTLF